MFKILNKLDGQLIGGPTWKGNFDYTYQFNKSFSDIGILSLKDTGYTKVSKMSYGVGSIGEMQVRIGENDISNAPNGYAFFISIPIVLH